MLSRPLRFCNVGMRLRNARTDSSCATLRQSQSVNRCACGWRRACSMRESNASKPMKNNETKTKSFEASLEALEQIVRDLEDGDLPLEKSLELFEQGIRLSRECQERLGQAERRIEILLRDNQGRTVVSEFAAEKDREDLPDFGEQG